MVAEFKSARLAANRWRHLPGLDRDVAQELQALEWLAEGGGNLESSPPIQAPAIPDSRHVPPGCKR